MPERTYASGNYRYGFNGKENDQDMSSDGLPQDYGMRIYEPRLGRWLSLDPLQSKYPSLTPYNFVANSTLNAVDPDGKVIIFINGLWGWPNNVGKGGTDDYWGEWKGRRWTAVAQDVIGDHKSPRYYDGSMGGTSNLTANVNPLFRMKAGYDAGKNDAKSIIDNLDKGETIKIITNSMGSAFERGFTFGIMEFQTEENERRAKFNAGIDNILAPLLEEKEFLEAIQKDGGNYMGGRGARRQLAQKIGDISSKINDLESRKKEILNVKIEMVIDLSSHQVDFPDPNAQSSYYMTAEENVTNAERLGGLGVKEKHIKGASYLGKMSIHHSTGANPTKLPSAANRN
jgi:RHS repeat-associated protein